MNLSIEIGSFLKRQGKGRLFAAPFDVYLDEQNNAVQPDLVVVLKENESIIRGHIHGVPDMLIEILSPGSLQHDTVRKKGLYERFGVREYWIVDPDTREAVGYELKEDTYAELGRATGEIKSRLLNGTFNF